MKKYVLLALVIPICIVVKAQRGFVTKVDAFRSSVRNIESRNRFISNISSQGKRVDNQVSSSNNLMKTTPFLFDDWLDGALILPDSTIIKENIQFKFDAQRNEVWIRLASGPIRILDNRELYALILKHSKKESTVLKKVKLTDSHSSSHFSVLLYESNHIQFFKDVKKGDYIIVYPEVAVIYDPVNDVIVKSQKNSN